MNAYLRIIGGLCIGRKRSASSCQRSALSYRLPFKLQFIFIKEPSVVSNQLLELNRFTRSIGKLISKRKPSAVNSQLSDMARPVRAISQLKPKTHQLSDTDRYVPAISKLIPKAYHLIPLLILVFVSCGAVLAQEPVGHTAPAAQAEITPLTIGDRIPDELWEMYFPVVAADSDEVQYFSLGDFKDKLIILDFWATWCSPCVAMIPKMDSLQKIFGDKIQFISVTYQKNEVVLPFLAKLEQVKKQNYHLPVLTDDSYLRFVFPHRELPHYVWIENGIVRSMTGHEEINEEFITKAIHEDEFNLPEKVDEIKIPYNRFNPLFHVIKQNVEPEIVYESLLTKHIKGLPSAQSYNRGKDGKNTTIHITNMPLKSFFIMAYAEFKEQFPDSKVIIDVLDSSKLIFGGEKSELNEWMLNNSFCYELSVPEFKTDKVFELMREDLSKYFPQYEVGFQKRNILSLVLVRTSSDDKIKSKGSEVIIKDSRFGLELKNRPISLLVALLNTKYMQTLSTPVVDGTEYPYPIDMVLDADLSDVHSIREALKMYDLDMLIQEAEVDVLVIRDNLKL